jgi:DNA adenine methylase
MKGQHNRFLRYHGNKKKFIDKFNELAKLSTCPNYFEPFVGSGAIFFNLEKSFDCYTINDISSNLMKLYAALDNFEYKQFVDILMFITEKYGNIKTNKESYYAFRNEYNEKIYNKLSPEVDGIYLYFLYNSCINSLARFGPHGFNQSYGNRLYMFDEKTFFNLKMKLENIVSMTNVDFLKADTSNIKNTLIYMDPPYINSKTCYEKNANTDDLIDKINQLQIDNDIILTNVYSEVLINRLEGFKYELVDQLLNVSPLKNSEMTNFEYVYYKIKGDK